MLISTLTDSTTPCLTISFAGVREQRARSASPCGAGPAGSVPPQPILPR